ncbi:hypothetical protein C8R46DRAFT_1349621 [Mycena filopes]|nr:hypothetical protein C8R46DRAFT_1349621 [Mycena filopes]
MTKTLHIFAGSVWAAAAELATAELYNEGDVEAKSINLFDGDNFDPAFLKVNPNGTLPTLEADGKVYTTTADVVAYLAKESSTKVKAATEITTTIHEQKYDPNFAMVLCRTDAELAAKAAGIPGMFIARRQAGLEKYSASADGASYKAFYEAKMAAERRQVALVAHSPIHIFMIFVSEEAKAGFLASSQAHFENIKTAILEFLPSFLPESGFIGGDVPGEDDFHVGAWLTRIAATTGAKTAEEAGKTMEVAYGAPVPAKVAAYWGAWTAEAELEEGVRQRAPLDGIERM